MDRRSSYGGLPWNEAPEHLLPDRDGAFGPAYLRRLRAMGIAITHLGLARLGKNGYVERLIGSIRRECLHHVLVFGEAQLHRLLDDRGASVVRGFILSAHDWEIEDPWQDARKFSAPMPANTKAMLHAVCCDYLASNPDELRKAEDKAAALLAITTLSFD